MRRTLLAAVLLVWIGDAAMAQPMGLTRQERNFIAEALADSLAERALGKLAQDRAEDEAVHRFARRMVDEHEVVADRLVGMAQRHDIAIPREPNLTAKAHMASLRDTPDGAFDRRYMAAEEETHARAIKLYSALAEREGETAEFARATLPMLHAHFEEGRAILGDLARRQTQEPPNSGASQ